MHKTNDHLGCRHRKCFIFYVPKFDTNDIVSVSFVYCLFVFVVWVPDCVKGYYKRAKAHAAVWNKKEARRDFNMVAHLDVTLTSLVHRELKNLSERMKEKYWEEKEQYWNKLDKKDNEGEGEETVTNTEEYPSDEVQKDEAKGAADVEEARLTQGKDWQQMLRLVMLLQKEGNFLITESQFKEASEKFKDAIEYVDFLQNKVREVMNKNVQ